MWNRIADSGNRRSQGSLKEQFKQTRSDTKRSNTPRSKKATFAALPNQTTWADYAASKSTGSSSPHGVDKRETEGDDDQVTPQAEIRMLLGESRRKIEDGKRKSEMQVNKQRQRVGKQAFMQVSHTAVYSMYRS